MNQTETVETETVTVVKRYANRKLYDTNASKYITLTELQAIVKAGQNVRVIENISKQDITKKTLLASLIETESKNETLSTDEVITLIKRGLINK